MSTFPWLTVAGAIPLVGAIAVALTPGPVRAGRGRGPPGPRQAGQA